MVDKNGPINAERLLGDLPEDSALRNKTVTALTDADATLTAAQLLGGLFTITPSTARTLTTDTAANIVAAIRAAKANMSFEVTIQVLAAYAVTVSGGTGVTMSGNAAPNDIAATFVAVVTNATAGSEAVTMYRKDGGAT